MGTSKTSVVVPGEFSFDGKDVSINFASANPGIINDIENNSSFPPGDIAIGVLSASVSTGAPVQLGDSNRNIAFSFSAGSSYSLGVISTPNQVLNNLNADRNIASGIDFKSGTSASDRFMLLKLSYNLGGTAKGTAALAAGLTANFGATGHVNGDWDVVHRFGEGARAQSILKATFSAWRLPRQIQKPQQLDPGTWLIAEIAGSIALNLGVQAGYDYSWLKQLPDGNLAGDIGVKVALAASASLGFAANGNFALALSRPDTSNKLRLAVYKLAKNDWNFALNASAGIQGVLPPALQKSADPTDLIKAVFGLQATQLINDLKAVQKVAAGGKLTDQAADYLEELGKAKLGAAASALDAFNQGVETVDALISDLKTLGNRTMNEIVTLLPSSSQGGKNVLADLTKVLTDIKGAAGDPTKIGSVIATELQSVAFFQTNFGKWLTSLLQDMGQASPLAALKDGTVLQAIGKAASTALNIVNGGDLQTLIDFAADKLNLKDIPALENIDPWLKAKIASFLNKTTGSVIQEDLTKVQNLVNLLFKKADTFWEEAIKAAQKQYEITFVATWENTTEDTAMLDVVFDFDKNPTLTTQLQAAINGDFTQILVDPSIAGITLNTGVLTHGIHRQTHVELSLPLLDLGSTTATDVVANLTVKHDGGGRVLAYSVEGNNDIRSFIAGRSARDSQMTLIMNVDPPTGIQRPSDFKASFGYSLRAANAKLSNRQLITAMVPLVGSYFLPLRRDEVENWVVDLDKITESVPTGEIGPALLSLDVGIDSKLPKVWFSAPKDPKDPVYFALSRMIQQNLRQLISSVYFAAPSRYADKGTAYPLLVYRALRSINSFDIDQETPPRITALTNSAVYWNWTDNDYLTALVYDSRTQRALIGIMDEVTQILTSLGNGSAKYYSEDNLQYVLTMSLQSSPASVLPEVLGSFIVFECNFINSVIGAASALAEFMGQSAQNPSMALKALTEFSGAVVKTFNQFLSSDLFAGEELAMLGSALFTQVTLSLASAVSAVLPDDSSPAALFSITIPKPSAKLSVSDLQTGKYTPEQILVEQKLASSLANLARADWVVK